MYMNLGSRAGRGRRLIGSAEQEIGAGDADREIPPGTPLRTVLATPFRTYTTVTSSIPLDGTPPRFDEGQRIQSAIIEVSKPNSRLWAEWDGIVARGANTTHPTVTLFLDDESSARAGAFASITVASATYTLRVVGELIPGSAGVHAVHVNVGPGNNTEPVYINGSAAAGIWGGGVAGTQLRVTEVAGEVMTWAGGQDSTSLHSAPQSGTLSTAAPGLTNYTVGTPNGETPTESDLASHRYRHHTAVAEHNGRVWVANSSGGTNEGAGGQMTVVASSLVSSVSFSAPTLVIPPQSTFSGTGDALQTGTRVTYPRCFAVHEGKLYLIGAVDQFVNTPALGDTLAIALFACECKDDGTIGPLFRVSSQSYTPMDDADLVNYDAVLGPPLLERAILHGIWGGSHPDSAQLPWTMWAKQGGAIYCEPTTIDIKGDGSYFVRLWRRLTAPDTRVWGQYSRDGGTTWSDIRELDIPNSPSSLAGTRLPNGKIALVGNMNTGETLRDPLYLALFDPDYCVRQSLYYVRQGVETVPTYPGEYKGGGAQYPGVWVGPTDLWVSYSIAKETIGVTRIPLSGL